MKASRGQDAATERALHDMFDFGPVQLAREDGAAGGVDASAFDDAVRGGGSRVPHQAQMESAFGRDLGFVQAHTGAAGAMGALGAQAAARGDEVAFAEHAPSPWLVAHELTHVMQQ